MSSSTTTASEVVFVTNKPRLRSHNKSRGGCSTCKARKVKCPENRPTCRTCARRGEVCIYNHRPNETMPQGGAEEGTLGSRSNCSRDDEQSGLSTTSVVSTQRQDLSRHRSHAMSTTWTGGEVTPDQLNWTDRDDLEVIRSCNFYNTFVVKDVAPPHAPFRRVEIPVEVWRYYIPKMLQHVWISLMKSMQATRAGLDPFNIADICQYRGSGLRELKQALSSATDDPYGMVLASVMTMMTTDLYTGGPWTTHLEAARRIMVMNGGFMQCFERISTLRRLLFNYIIADAFSATTCNSMLINDSCLEMHAAYIKVLDDSDSDVFECSRPCPRQLIQAIARINMLRTSLNHQATIPADSLQLTIEELSDFIQKFDATTWAITASNYGKVLPARADDCLAERDAIALSSYASCYHSATLLYFLLSCATPLSPADRLRVQLASQNLSQHTRSLFESATSDQEGPIYTQLWKLVSWPILIGLYAGIGWDIGKEEADVHLEHIRKLSMLVGSTRIMDVTKLMYRVGTQRARCSAADWKWDDGFYTRCAFAL